MAYDPSGKFQLVSSGNMMLPAQCAGCGTVHNDDGFVDTKIDAEFYGIIYFCCNCAFELTTVFPEAPYHTMRARILSLEELTVTKDARIDELERALDGLTALRLVDRDVSIIGGAVIGADVSESAEPDAVVNADGEGSGDNDPEPSESVTQPGPTNPSRAKRSHVTSDI